MATTSVAGDGYSLGGNNGVLIHSGGGLPPPDQHPLSVSGSGSDSDDDVDRSCNTEKTSNLGEENRQKVCAGPSVLTLGLRLSVTMTSVNGE